MSNSTGVSRIRTNETRTAEALLAEQTAQIESEKIFVETNVITGINGPGIANQGTAAGNYLSKAGDLRGGPMGNEFSIVEIINNSISVDVTSGQYTPVVIVNPEGGVDDILDTIVSGTNPFFNQELILQGGNLASSVTLQEGAGNILTPGGADVILNLGDMAGLIFSQLVLAWIVLWSSTISGGATSFPILYPKEDLTPGIAFNQTIDLSIETGNAKQIQFPAGDIGLQIIGDPANTVAEDVYVMFIQDGVGGRSLSTVDSAIKNGSLMDNLLDKNANAKTTFRLATLDGGVSYHAILVDLTTGAGDVVGPGLSTDEALARFDGITGKIIQNSTVLLSDTGAFTEVAGIDLFTTVANNITNMSTLTFVSDLAATRGQFGRSDAVGGTDPGLVLNVPASQNFSITKDAVEKIIYDATDDELRFTATDILAAGAGRGVFNIGHLDFINNLATPGADVAIYSDGTFLKAKSNAIAGNIFLTSAIEDLNMVGFSIDNILSLDIEDSTGNTQLGISGPLGVGGRLQFATGNGLFFTENITDIVSIDASGMNLLSHDITMGTGGDIQAGGAGVGMTFIGRLEFVDNLATPVATFAIFSDGVDLFGNTGSHTTNFDNLPELTITNTFTAVNTFNENIIAGGSGDGVTNIGHLDFVDNLATPGATVSLYSDGTDLFSKSSLNMNNQDIKDLDDIFFFTPNIIITSDSVGMTLQVPTGDTIDLLVNGSRLTLSETQLEIKVNTIMTTNNLTFTTGDLTMGTGEIIAGGAAKEINNIGELVFVNNTLTPAGNGILFFDGTDLKAKTGATTVNLTDIGGSNFTDVNFRVHDEINLTANFKVNLDGATNATTSTLDFNQTADRTFTFPNASGTVFLTSAVQDLVMGNNDITSSAGNGMTDIGILTFTDNLATPGGITIYSDGTDIFFTTGLDLDGQGLKMGNSNVTEVDTVVFFDAGGQINVSAGVGGFNFVTTSDVPFRFTPNTTNVLDIDDTGLTMITGNIELGNGNVTGINQVAFNVPGQTITDGLTALTIAVGSGDTIQHNVNSVPTLEINEGFLDLFGGFVDMTERASPANPPANERRIFVNSATQELSVRTSTGSTISLEGAGAISLNDLTDVVISSPVEGNAFIFGGSGAWVNKRYQGLDSDSFKIFNQAVTGQTFNEQTWYDTTVISRFDSDAFERELGEGQIFWIPLILTLETTITGLGYYMEAATANDRVTMGIYNNKDSPTSSNLQVGILQPQDLIFAFNNDATGARLNVLSVGTQNLDPGIYWIALKMVNAVANINRFRATPYGQLRPILGYGDNDDGDGATFIGSGIGYFASQGASPGTTLPSVASTASGFGKLFSGGGSSETSDTVPTMFFRVTKYSQ